VRCETGACVHVSAKGDRVVVANDDGDSVEFPAGEWRAYLGYAHSDDRAQWETLCWEALSLMLQAADYGGAIGVERARRSGWDRKAQAWENKFKAKVESNMKWESVSTPVTEDAPSVSTNTENGDGIPAV
jgi:hypothetical protein